MRFNMGRLCRIGWIGLGGVILLLAGGFALFQIPAVQHTLVHSPVTNWLYRRLTPEPAPSATFADSLTNHFPGFAYAAITHRLTNGLDDPQQIVLRVSEYIHENIFSLEAVIQDDAPITVLRRGIGVCDQMAHLLVRLVDQRNIPAYLVFLKSSESSALPHSVGEVYFDGAWRFVDPLYLANGIGRDGKLASRQEISEGEATFDPPLEVVGLGAYRTLYEKEPVRFLNNLSAQAPLFEAIRDRQPLPTRKRQTLWRTFLALPDWMGAGLYTKLYLTSLHELYPERSEWLYQSARIHQMLLWYPEARRWYARLLRQYPETPHREEALFFTEVAAYHEGNYSEAVKSYQTLLRNHPDSVWIGYAHLIMAQCNLAQGNRPDALRLLQVLSAQEVLGEPSRMARRLLHLTKNNSESALRLAVR